MTDEQRWQMFRELLGYVGNGTSTAVQIDQDDATNDWIVRVGCGDGKRVYYGRSLDEALQNAAAGRT